MSGKSKTVVECVLGVEAMAKDDVRDLEGEDGVEIACLLGSILGDDTGGVDEALGEDDGVAYGERLERLGHHGADTDGARDGNVVVGEDVAGEGFEGLIELAAWSVEEAGFEEALNYVVFRLLHPGALRAERADILRIVRNVGRAFNFDRWCSRIPFREPSST